MIPQGILSSKNALMLQDSDASSHHDPSPCLRDDRAHPDPDGLYGMLGYSVTERTREIGIRMALGARRSDVMRLVLRQGAMLTVLGLALGLVGAATGAQHLEGLLFGLTAFDPMTFIMVSVVFRGWLPSRRTCRLAAPLRSNH